MLSLDLSLQAFPEGLEGQRHRRADLSPWKEADCVEGPTSASQRTTDFRQVGQAVGRTAVAKREMKVVQTFRRFRPSPVGRWSSSAPVFQKSGLHRLASDRCPYLLIFAHFRTHALMRCFVFLMFHFLYTSCIDHVRVLTTVQLSNLDFDRYALL